MYTTLIGLSFANSVSIIPQASFCHYLAKALTIFSEFRQENLVNGRQISGIFYLPFSHEGDVVRRYPRSQSRARYEVPTAAAAICPTAARRGSRKGRSVGRSVGLR